MEILNISSDDQSKRHNQLHRVLILDDDAATLRMLESVVTRRGYLASTATTTKQAMEIITQDEIDILLSDINLDGESGLEFAKVVSELPRAPAVILMTGYYTEDSIIEAFDSGVSGYIKKPIDLPEFYRMLSTVMEDHENAKGGVFNIKFAPLWESAKAFIDSLSPKINCARWLTFESGSRSVFIDRFGAIAKLLLARGAEQDILDELITATNEVGTNAIEWGNDFNDSKTVRLAAGLSGRSIVIVIEDCGSGFKHTSVPDPVKDASKVVKDRALEGKRPGGFGISIVRAITDLLVYNTRGNIVVMQKQLHSRASRG